MLQVVQKKLYGSVTVFWLDRVAAVDAVRSAAKKLAGSNTSVRRVILFGSLATGTATAASDADIFIVMSDTDVPFLDRPVVFGEFFSGIGLPAELFVATEAELSDAPTSIAEHALRHGIDLLDAS
jgi:uncharacterized protein